MAFHFSEAKIPLTSKAWTVLTGNVANPKQNLVYPCVFFRIAWIFLSIRRDDFKVERPGRMLILGRYG
jgi:hypothetical protein